MNATTRKLIQMQGYDNKIICDCKDVNMLVRWTPLACAVFGTLGLYLKSPIYFVLLGLLTTIGGLTTRSFYDYIYNSTLRFVFGTMKTPLHGNQRRFGCSVGAFLFILGGLGFYTGNIWLSYLPTLFIISFAYVTAFSQWCFASTIYNFLFDKNKK